MKRIISLLLTVLFVFAPAFAVRADSVSVSDYSVYKEGSYSASQENIEIIGADYSASENAEIRVDNDFYGKRVLRWENEKGIVSYNFSLSQDADYYLKLFYGTVEGSGADIRVGIKIDGNYPFVEAEEVSFKRSFQNSGDVRADKWGNQFAPEQQERFGLFSGYAEDSLGRESEPFRFSISAGAHTLEIVAIDEPFAIEKIVFEAPKVAVSYEDYINRFSDKPAFDGKEIVIQGENADYKSASYLVPLSDMSEKSIISFDGKENNGVTETINYIGSTNWQSQGDMLTWKISVKEEGLYKLSLKYRQKYVTNGVSYRKLAIDGEVPFKEAESVSFPYDSAWEYMTFSDKDAKPYLIYLSAGEHTLSLTVTLGEFSEVYRDLSKVVDTMGSLYRKIVMITGETIDSNRSYELFKQIPGFNDSL
ncbi:MAG: hypothetical protein IKX78_05125, partial [Clostridia bacterium]|nr:hypothetical protein [Clostridia bacterium]